MNEPVPPPALSDVQPAASPDPATPPANNPATDGAIALDAGTIARVNQAADTAKAIVIEQQTGSGRRRRGRDRRPRNLPPQCQPGGQLPVEQLGAGAGALPGAPEYAEPLVPIAPAPPAFSAELLQAGAALTTDLANDVAVTGMEWWALYQLREAEAAKAVAQTVRMKEDRERRIRQAIVTWAETNPEAAMRFFGKLLVIDPALWLGDIARIAQAVKAQGDQLRAAGPVTHREAA